MWISSLVQTLIGIGHLWCEIWAIFVNNYSPKMLNWELCTVLPKVDHLRSVETWSLYTFDNTAFTMGGHLEFQGLGGI